MKSILILAFCFFIVRAESQNSISATYVGLIPTSYNIYDESCNGQSATLSVTLPAGESYNVTSVDVVYNMTGFGSGWKSQQRSKIKLENNNVEEATEAAGLGDATGTQAYSRSISVFNGTYGGGTVLTFQMKARRTHEGVAGCHNSINRVDGNTWIITVNYSNEVINPKVGVNTSSPSQSMEVGGKLKLGDDSTAPLAGTVRWNTTTQDFEGYNGSEWLSFTKSVGGNWGKSNVTENQSLDATNGSPGDKFGNAVSIFEDYAIVGAQVKDNGSNDAQGRAYIFKRTENTWTEQANFTSSDGAALDYFGSSVSISGEYAIVGAFGKDIGANSNQGKAYIFKRTNNTWVQETMITAPDGSDQDYFGNSVSIDGNYVVIGAKYKDIESNLYQGKAYIYKRSGTNWNFQAFLTASDGEAEDNFGSSVAISGNYAIISSPSNYNNKGKAYIFKRTDTQWWQMQSLIANDGTFNDQFGISVAISGEYVIIGSPGKSSNSINFHGKAYIFKRTGGLWLLQAGIVPNDKGFSDYFGSDVSISGDFAIIGAYNKKIGLNDSQGKAYIFKRLGAIWSQETDITASNGEGYEEYGNAVAIYGDYSIVGCSLKDIGSFDDHGAVYFYNK